MTEPIAYLCGEIIPASQLSVAPYDKGFMWGVTVAEQLRTFGGKLFGWSKHVSRLERGLEIIGLKHLVDPSQLLPAAERVTQHNHALLEQGDDLAVAVFVTPGAADRYGAPVNAMAPVVAIHTYPLPFALWSDAYDHGQSCVVSEVPQVSSRCWPRDLKCRSRAHYYLADREARRVDAGARAILLDEHGEINEASTANVAVYFEREGIVAPPSEAVLPGISLDYVRQLAEGLGISFTHRRLRVAEFRAADEILLTSTPFCILPVTKLDGQSRPPAKKSIAHQLLARWSETVGVDIVQQAQNFACRPRPQ